MKLSIGIVGLPNVGKSTLFKLLSKNDILVANYPFATIDPNVGIVPVPDERIDMLAKMSNSAKKIPAVVEFYDIAGLVKGAATGEGLGNQFLSHIREVSAIVHVLRCFESAEIIHVENSVDPLRDRDTITAELALKDLETVERRLDKAMGEARSGNKQAQKDTELLTEIKTRLSGAKSIQEFREEPLVKELALLSAKPKFYLLNGTPESIPQVLKEEIAKEKSDYVIANLGTSQEVPELITKAYQILGLISFFTTGEDETRAWTIREGERAPQAAGTIHSDFEKKFIRAEVVAYKDFVECGGWSPARQKGKLRAEGKEYIVQDGDILEIRHS